MLARLVMVALAAQVGLVATADSSCDSTSTMIDACTVENTGSQVDVGASRDEPGRAAGDLAVEGGSGEVVEPVVPGVVGCVVGRGELCRGNYGTAVLPDVTMADLASFRPTAPGLVSEPAGIGVAGLPTNLLSSGSVHTVVGELFGYAVTVRFTPVGFVFDHGDGTSSRTDTGGAGWNTLGQAVFTPTDTSHVYRERGVYSASVMVSYTAQVDFGGGWRDVPGTLELASGGYPIRVVEARTALVDHTCNETPTAPGC